MSLSEERSEAAEVMSGLVPKVSVADPPWSPSDGLTLYHCLSTGALVCLRSFWQNAELAGTHSMRPVHCWGELYPRKVREVQVEHLSIADACFCRVTIAPSRIRHPNIRLGKLAARMCSKGDVVPPYYGTTVYQGQSFRQSRRKLYENGALKMEVARACRFALQLRV